MVQRVNITLPDELHQRLQAFKEDKSLNVSAICQEALEQEVTLREAVAKAMSKREATIARLKVQAQNELNEWYQEGKTNGLDTAPEWDYIAFVTLSDWINADKDATDLPRETYDIQQMFESVEIFECPERFHSQYLTGFADGVLEFWNEIRDEVEPELAH